jgi:serine/threonine protein kinase
MAPSLLFLFVVVVATANAAARNMTDAEALMQLRKYFTNSSSLSSWLITTRDGNKSPCAEGPHAWHGVVCGRNGAVTSLRLSGLELGGTIDVDALAAFPALRSVSFARNNFSGPLPAFHHQLTALKSLYLSNNSFSGAIPDGFFAGLGHLKKLWLDGNRLSGPVPASVAQAKSLLELRLDRNALTGTLPDAPPPALRSFDVSQNDLEGVVPEAFRRFEVARFAGNEYLCYVPTHVKRCKREEAVSSASKRVVLVLASLLVSAVVVAVVLCACTSQSSSGNNQRRLDNDMEGLEDKPLVYMSKQASAPQKRSSSWLARRAGSSLGIRRAASAARADDLGIAAAGDLVIVNDSKGVFGLTDLMKAAAEVIRSGSGGLGSSYKAVMASGVAVVVKRARDMNRAPDRDSFDAAMRRLGATRHANLLPPLAYHYRSDEKLVVHEYIPKGSLLYVLHGDRGMDYAALDWPARLKVAAGVARGTAFLHATALPGHHDLSPHGNLKSANVLLAPDFEPLLVDFGLSGLASPRSTFASRAPECAAGRPAGAKADVYCLGIVLLELLTGRFPSQYKHNASGGTDLVMWAASATAEGVERDLFDPAVVTASKFALPDMARLMRVAVDCVEADPEKRPDMKQAAARVEEVVATALAAVRERQEVATDSEESARQPGNGSSHAAYARERPMSVQRVTSVGERSSRRGSGDYS